MGLFSTVLHIYQRSQSEVLDKLSEELAERGLPLIIRIDIDNDNYLTTINDNRLTDDLVYLIVKYPGNWTTIIEVNPGNKDRFYLYDLTASLSQRLGSYALSFHFHDDDLLFYNLDKAGEQLDGYNSNYQYFMTERADRQEVLDQRHTPVHLQELLPEGKTVDGLNDILNEGYWEAFDRDELDDDGVAQDDKYWIDEQERYERVGKYLEIYTKDDYPFADWLSNLDKFDLDDCYLLKASPALPKDQPVSFLKKALRIFK